MFALAWCRPLAAGALALVLWLAARPAAAIQEIRLGVLSHRGTDLTLAHWQATADYLTDALAGYRFEIVPLPFSRITEFVEMEFVDFILVNPGIYVDLEVRHGISRLATLNNRVGPLSLNQFSSVIFTRQERHDLQRLADLAGQHFLAVDETSLGGFEMAWDELSRQGLDPYQDFARLEFAGDHDSVVMAVLFGQADAGTVRTDILERMAAQDLIDLDQFKVLNPQPTDRFPLVHSTGLYPEWPFSKVSHTPTALAQQVAVALLEMPPTTRRPWRAVTPAGPCPSTTSRSTTCSGACNSPPMTRTSPCGTWSSAIGSGWWRGWACSCSSPSCSTGLGA